MILAFVFVVKRRCAETEAGLWEDDRESKSW